MNTISNTLEKHLVRGIFMGMFTILLFRARGADAAALTQNCGQWKVVPSPSEGNGGQLNAVAVVSPGDMWAVAFYYVPGYTTQNLIEHWNDSSWSLVPDPSTGGLLSIAAVASNDVWAVGYGGYIPLIEHWDGTQWSIVPSP
jgi:hypothetical protein